MIELDCKHISLNIVQSVFSGTTNIGLNLLRSYVFRLLCYTCQVRLTILTYFSFQETCDANVLSACITTLL